jgi:hypothetical protein
MLFLLKSVPINDELLIGPVLAGMRRSYVHNNDVSSGMFSNDMNFNYTSDEFGHCSSIFCSNDVAYENNINNVGPCLHSAKVGSLGKTMDSAMGKAMLDKEGERNIVDLQGRMRNASPMKTTGESSSSLKKSSNIVTSTLSLSEIENEVEVRFPSTEEVIAFGGIPKPSIGVRSSTRLGSCDALKPVP